MNPESLPVPEESREAGEPLGEDVLDVSLDMSLDDAEGLDLQAFADEIADATPDGGPEKETPRTGNTVNLDDPDYAKAEQAVVADVEGLSSQLGETITQLKRLEIKEQEALDQFRRLSKDFTNFRARAARDIQMGVDQAERKLLLEFLPILDNFDRSLESNYADMDAFRNGVMLIRKQFQDSLRRCGAEPAPMEIGDPFSAHTAEALTTMSREDLPDGSVAAIYEKAYLLRDQLLRPAKVVVNHRPGGDPPPAGAFDTVNLNPTGDIQ